MTDDDGHTYLYLGGIRQGVVPVPKGQPKVLPVELDIWVAASTVRMSLTHGKDGAEIELTESELATLMGFLAMAQLIIRGRR